eukprot:jgi/Antlo1/176/2290
MQNLHHVFSFHLHLFLSDHYVVCLIKDHCVPWDLVNLPIAICDVIHVIRHTQHVELACALVCHCMQNLLHLLGIDLALLSSKHLDCSCKLVSVPLNLHCTTCTVHVCSLRLCAQISHCSQNRLHLLSINTALLSSKHLNCPAIYLSFPLKTHVDSVCFLLDHVAPFVYRLDFILVGEVHSECSLVWKHADVLCAETTQHMHSHAHHSLQIHGLFFIVCKCGECCHSVIVCCHFIRAHNSTDSMMHLAVSLWTQIDRACGDSRSNMISVE